MKPWKPSVMTLPGSCRTVVPEMYVAPGTCKLAGKGENTSFEFNSPAVCISVEKP